MATIAQACPNCGAPLNIAPGDTAVTCAHCGSSIRITSEGSAVPFFHTEAQHNPQTGGVDLEAVRQELAAGRKIQAIKIVREQTGMGLAEAKDFVDALEDSSTAPETPPATTFIPASAAEEEIRQLIVSGQKIEAIKRYREVNDTSLAEAKAAVEAIERGERPPAWTAPADTRSADNVDWSAIRSLVASGNKLEAIKLYRAQTGASLEEALPVIDALPENRSTGTSRAARGGCGGIILGIVFFCLLIFAGCGQYIRTTDMHACVVNYVTSDSRVRESLGTPLEINPLLISLGYSSESDFSGTDRSAGYLMYVKGSRSGALFYVEAYETSTGYFGVQANPVPNPNDFFIQASGQSSACSGGG